MTGEHHSFTTGAQGCGQACNTAHGLEPEAWIRAGEQQDANEAPRLEAEREAKKREEEERPVKEAATRAAKEREVREAGERAGREAAERAAREATERERAALARSIRCTVPRLKRDSLTAARKSLHKAHCALGRVDRPAGHHGALVVIAQGIRADRKLPDGTAVDVRLGSARDTRHR
jgi:hypothetical protein